MKTCRVFKFPTLIVSLICGVILISASWTTVSSIGTAYAILPATPYVKITSPHKGQQVPVGNILVSGTSSDNTTSDCQVYIILNSIKPYQRTLPTGHGGVDDYSTWNYQLTPKYATVKVGVNKITAKISCAANPINTTKFYSINITGVTAIAGNAKRLPIATTAKPISNNTASGNSSSVVGTVENKSHRALLSPSPILGKDISTNNTVGVSNSNITSFNASMMDVKITSPIKGEQVPVGSNFTIFGTSTSSAFDDCRVYSGWNNLKPMHIAVPAGPKGSNDYSMWNFTYSSSYHTITYGTNELTAKLSCQNNPALIKYYTVNVVGVNEKQEQQVTPTTNGTTPLVLPISSLASNNNESSSTGLSDPSISTHINNDSNTATHNHGGGSKSGDHGSSSNGITHHHNPGGSHPSHPSHSRHLHHHSSNLAAGSKGTSSSGTNSNDLADRIINHVKQTLHKHRITIPFG